MLELTCKLCCFLALLCAAAAQDCLTPSEPCSDTKQCCGGCCISGMCTTTYDSCNFVDYPCINDYCPPGFECYMYKPSEACVGCGMQRACRPFQMPAEETTEQT